MTKVIGASIRCERPFKPVPHFDVLLPIAVYYAIGLWSDIDELDWTRAWRDSRRDLDRLLSSAPCWLADAELARIEHARKLMG